MVRYCGLIYCLVSEEVNGAAERDGRKMYSKSCLGQGCPVGSLKLPDDGFFVVVLFRQRAE